MTIGNQDRQIKLLIDRCETLETNSVGFRNILRDRKDELDKALDMILSLQKSYTRLLGWQDCARELLVTGTLTGAKFEPFPTDAPGS